MRYLTTDEQKMMQRALRRSVRVVAKGKAVVECEHVWIKAATSATKICVLRGSRADAWKK